MKACVKRFFRGIILSFRMIIFFKLRNSELKPSKLFGMKIVSLLVCQGASQPKFKIRMGLFTFSACPHVPFLAFFSTPSCTSSNNRVSFPFGGHNPIS